MYAESPDKTEVACAVSFVPTFDPIAPQDMFAVVEDEQPESASLLGPGSDFHFIFLVDRSGSMGMYGRMSIAQNALNLFMRSLPEGCTFSIISFGSPTFSPLFVGQYYQEYNDGTRDAAIEEIARMSPNFGGTDILSPLQAAQSN